MIKKLSLAAIIAAGSMSVASATPLTEAIKGVDFSGYLRLRAYSESSSYDYNNRYRTTALFKFAVPVSEDLKFVNAYAYDWNIYSKPHSGALADGDSHVNNVKLFLKYKKNNLTAIAGKIPVATPVTGTGVGEATAAGAVALYKVNDSLTVAGAALADLVLTDQVSVGGNYTYAVAALASAGNLKAQLWGFKVQNIIDTDIVARVDYKMNNVAAHIDYARADLDHDITDDTQTYFNVNVDYKANGLEAKVGYAQTGEDGGTVTLDGDSSLASAFSTEQKTGITDQADTSAIYGKIGYDVTKKANTFLAVTSINDDTTADADYDEYMVGVKYAYTKKMRVYAYYSMLDGKNGADNNDNNEARIEFKYSF